MNYLLAFLRIDTLWMIASVTTSIFALTDAVAIILIPSVASTILGIITVYFAYRAKVFSERSEKAVNGITHEMIAMAKLASKAEGKLEGKDEAELAAAKLAAAKLDAAAATFEKSDKIEKRLNS